MRLTLYTDYAMRVLLHLSAHEDRLTSINEIADAYGISRNHLMKVVQNLSGAGLVAASRGRNGGLRLGRPADHIRLGDVVRQTEEGFTLVDCSQCRIATACTLPKVLNEATQAFLAVLDRYTVRDLLERRIEMKALFGAPLAPRGRPAPALCDGPTS